jgi:hypothetical protein
VEISVRKNIRLRFWIEAGAAMITGLLCIITPFWPDWIEAISGWDPDQHNGSVEWLIAFGFFLVTLALFFLARTEWKRTSLAMLG